MNKFKYIVNAYIYTFPKTLTTLLAIAIAWLTLYYFYFSNIPCYFPKADRTAILTESICASYVCSCIFYFITSHIPNIKAYLNTGKILQPTIFSIIHKYSRTINAIHPEIFKANLNKDEFIEKIRTSPWTTKLTLAQTNKYGSGFESNQFPEALVELKQSVLVRARNLPLEARIKLSDLEFFPLWDFMEETPDFTKGSALISEFFAIKLYEIKEILDSLAKEYNIPLLWSDLHPFQIRILR